jgi:lipopolysaccharide transport system permease protein/teichoic acid transport system permease protein
MAARIGTLIKSFSDFFLTLYYRRFLIAEMAKRDIAQNQIGSFLGFFWTFINPIVLICILWLVFSVGFKTPTASGAPFVVWLTTGLIIWNAFAETVNGATAVVRSNPHLVKKVLFPLSILPVVKLVAALMVHMVFILILIALILAHGLPSSIYWLQSIYYLAAMMAFVLGLSWITSALFVFIRDVGQIINVLLQFGFWSTPIFWNLDMMPAGVRVWLKLNPMYYLVQGYRDSFLQFVPFWHHPALTLYFWCVTSVTFVFGAIVFQRLKPSFADVL